MKSIFLSLIFVLITFNTSPVFAQNTPTPTSAPRVEIEYMNEFTVDNEPSIVVELLENFIEGFDSFIGGFVFYTPDPLGNTIILKDGSEIPGVTKYRNMFYDLTLPILAIIIAAIAISKLGSDNAKELKNFAFRLMVTLILFLTVPHVLSYSIQANNLLVERVQTTQKFTTFLDEYFEAAKDKIDQGESSEKFGIPSFDISLTGGIFRSLGKFIVQIFLFALTFLFLLLGFLYIGFQFVIRFAALLFLGVLYPVILPFMLAERTQSIVYTFFKSWFTFLIQQPAFVLGFAIATDIFMSILNSKGPSVGMLFFYTGFLFFLGGVNMLVARIFGDTWTAFSTNMGAAVAYRGTIKPTATSVQNVKRGFIGGNGSVSTAVGQKLRRKWDSITSKKQDSSDGEGKPPAKTRRYSYISSGAPVGRQGAHYTKAKGTGSTTYTSTPNVPRFSQTLGHRGMDVKMENARQGVVSVSGSAYRFDDKKKGLSTLYSTRLDAVHDGVPESKLKKVELDQDKFIDLSTFSKDHPNPHNYNAMQEAKKKGRDINYAYVTATSPPQKIKRFLDLSKQRNDAYGIKGVVVKRQGKDSHDNIIRLYTDKKHEKRKNI